MVEDESAALLAWPVEVFEVHDGWGWKCLTCGDHVVGRTKGGITREAERHYATKHAKASAGG